MVPAEFMTAAVAMLTDALPKSPYFGNKLFTRHLVKVGVHGFVPEIGLSTIRHQGTTARKRNAPNNTKCTAPCRTVERPLARVIVDTNSVSANSTISVGRKPSINGSSSMTDSAA